jgi:hypothetical protein
MIADAIDQPFRERKIAEEYIHYVAKMAVPKALTLERISAATQKDEVLQTGCAKF